MKYNAVFCQQMIDRYKVALLEAPLGVSSWSIGGESVSLENLEPGLAHWQSQLEIATGRSAGIVSLDLS